MIAVLAVALAAQPPAAVVPISGSVDTVRADPARFGRQRVQVHGWIQRCGAGHQGCFLTSEEDGGGSFLPIEGDPATLRALDEWAPAQVVVEARVVGDRFRRAAVPRFNTVIIVEQAAGLRDVRLVRVLREPRQPSPQGE